MAKTKVIVTMEVEVVHGDGMSPSNVRRLACGLVNTAINPNIISGPPDYGEIISHRIKSVANATTTKKAKVRSK